MVRDVFKDEYSKKAPADHSAFARKLLQQGLETKNDPTSRFVLLREAREQAVQGGDPELALKAVSVIAEEFMISAAAEKQTVLVNLAKGNRTQPELKTLATLELLVADEAALGDEIDLAVQASAAASALAKRAKDLALVTTADAKTKELNDLRVLVTRFKTAREKLVTTPEDAASNGAVGSYLCLIKGDWDQGLLFLSKGDDATLRPLAERDLKKPQDAPGQASLADGWWEAGEKASIKARPNLRQRAGYWYRMAVGQLGGLTKTKVEKRLLECGALRGSGRWLDVSDWKLYAFDAQPKEGLLLDPPGDKSLWIQLMKFPTGTFNGLTAHLRFDKNAANGSGGIRLEKQEKSVWIMPSEKKVVLCRHNVSGTWSIDTEGKCETKSEYVLTILVEKGEYIVQIDGEEKLRLKTPVSSIDYVALNAKGGIIVFDHVQLRYSE